MDSFVDRIRGKLAGLAAADPDLKLFGAGKHKYLLGPTLTEGEVKSIESRYGMKLPDDYRHFLLEMGDGGAGPYYGVQPLADAIKYSGTADNPFILSKRFPLNKPLLLFDECVGEGTWDDYYSRIETDEKYYDKVQRCISRFNKPYYTQGTLYLCDYGDAIAFHLVVTGRERGNIWIEDRAGDFGGIFPLSPEGKGETRTTFLTWYKNWLDRVLQKGEESTDYFEYA